MKRGRAFPGGFLMVVTMIVACAVVLGGLCARTVVQQRRAEALSGAAIAASNAASAFYATDSVQELAVLLGGTADADQVAVGYDEDWRPGGAAYRLCISLRNEGTMEAADIAVTGGEAEILAMQCDKYRGNGE